MEQQRVLDAFLGRGAETPSGELAVLAIHPSWGSYWVVLLPLAMHLPPLPSALTERWAPTLLPAVAGLTAASEPGPSQFQSLHGPAAETQVG